MSQFYQCVFQNVDDIKRLYPTLNLDNCVVMNDDGTQYSPQQIVLSDPVLVDGQLQRIIYQSPTQSNQIATEQPTQFVIQDDEPQMEQTYSLVNNQPNQVFYTQPQQPQQQPLQQHVQNTIEQPVVQQQLAQNQQLILQQYRPNQQLVVTNANASPMAQQQQIIIQNIPQQGAMQVNAPQNSQNVVLQQPQHFQNESFMYDQVVQQQNSSMQTEQIQLQNIQDQQTQQQQQQIQVPNLVAAPQATQQHQQQPQQQIITKAGQIVRRAVSTTATKQVFFTRQGGVAPNAVKIIQSPGIGPQVRPVAPNQIRPQRIYTTVLTRPRNAISVARQRAPIPRPVDQAVNTSSPVPGTIQVRPRILTKINSPRLNTMTLSGANLVRMGTVVRTTAPSNIGKTVAVQTAAPVKSLNNSAPVEDLEESIAAAKITKPPTVPPPQVSNMTGDENKMVQLSNGTLITLTEFRLQQQRLQQQQQQQQLQQKQIIVGTNKVRARAPAPPVLNRRPQAGAQTQIPQTTEAIDQQKSAKMLVILQNGEQRLITFTLPKESCTVQELLEQVSVPFSSDTNIQCIPNPGANIDYLVTVGVLCTETPSEIIQAAQNSLQSKSVQQHEQSTQKKMQDSAVQKDGTPKAKIDNKERFIPGMLAVCSACGYSSQDHYQCQRCNRIFSQDTKKIPVSSPLTISKTKQTVVDKQKLEMIQKKHQISTEIKVTKARKAPTSITRSRAKAKPEEPVILTLSSDDEDDETSKEADSMKEDNESPKNLEPNIEDDVVPADFLREDVFDLSECKDRTKIPLSARQIRFGTFMYEPKDDIVLTSKGIRIIAPHIKRTTDKVVLHIQKSEIVKILYNFTAPCVLIVYVLNSCSKYVREQIGMSKDNKSGYFSPFGSFNERNLIFELDPPPDTLKTVIKSLYSSNSENITANDAKQLVGQCSSAQSVNTVAVAKEESDVVRKILIYPPSGKGGISINTEDYLCLASDQYLNDVIIDFYLQYVLREMLTPEQRQKTHVFSSFFYNRLTQSTKSGNSNGEKLTAAQKRHERVKTWTKNVNLFDKDFIIIPINEQSHWFLAIICYPALKGPVTMDGDVPVKPIPIPNKKKANPSTPKSSQMQIGNTTITPVSAKKEPEAFYVEDNERDEAEGDDSELASDESDNEVIEPKPSTDPIKQPCILLFDSLLGANRNRVVATLRDYLTCEYKVKVREATNHTFTKLNIPGNNVKVPQQTNFTDCGLYVLQYVEHFFKDPIKDYRLPIKHLNNWFEPIIVTKKREDISHLIKSLVSEYKSCSTPLPDIQLPTKDGELVEIPDFSEEHANFEEEHLEESKETEQPQSQPEPQPEQQITVQTKRILFKHKNNISDINRVSEIKAKKKRTQT